MMPPSMESIFLILSGAILAAGVLYWMWSHIQLTQKKVQLLENAVFELRSLLTRPESGPGSSGPGLSGSGPSGSSGPGSSGPGSSGPSADPVYNDLADDEDWADESEAVASTPLEALNADVAGSPGSVVGHDIGHLTDADLQPGGAAGQGIAKEEPAGPNEQFRELFIQQQERVPTPLPSVKETAPVAQTDSSLDSMPVKELRRLAEQRGITGVSDLRKKELLAALRQAAQRPQEERTLDLTNAEASAETSEPDTVEIEEVPILE